MPKTSKSQKPPTSEQLIDYIEALEGANRQLVIALKRCLELLANVPPEVADKKKWKSMLDDLNEVAEVVERITKHESNKILH